MALYTCSPLPHPIPEGFSSTRSRPSFSLGSRARMSPPGRKGQCQTMRELPSVSNPSIAGLHSNQRISTRLGCSQLCRACLARFPAFSMAHIRDKAHRERAEGLSCRGCAGIGRSLIWKLRVGDCSPALCSECMHAPLRMESTRSCPGGINATKDVVVPRV